jgi:purine-binding chemotaxis protein CheW
MYSNDSWKVRLLQVQALTLGVSEEKVLTVVKWAAPTPLPFAPPSVIGVVSVQGRMFTVLDVGVLLDNKFAVQNAGAIVALRGDEQLALAVDDTRDVVEVKAGEIKAESASNLIRGTISVRGKDVLLLDIDSLFAGVIRGHERRRRRL